MNMSVSLDLKFTITEMINTYLEMPFKDLLNIQKL